MAGKSVNKVILIGNLGKDPEVKFTPSGTPVAKIALATNERFKDKSGEWQDRTEWHNVVLWQRLAEIAGEYLKKGGKVYIGPRPTLESAWLMDVTSGGPSLTTASMSAAAMAIAAASRAMVSTLAWARSRMSPRWRRGL